MGQSESADHEQFVDIYDFQLHFPIFFTALYLWPRFARLRTKKFKKRFLPVYEMLNLRHGKATMLWPLMFMVRRALFVVAICALIQQTANQIFLFIIPTIASMAILAGVNPLESRPINRLEIFNSIMILMMGYCLMSFTPVVENPQSRYLMGFVMVFFTGLNILFNIVAVSLNPIRFSCIRFRVRWA